MTHVRALSEQWFQAWLDKDAEVIDRLAADDHTCVGPGGASMDRAKIRRLVRRLCDVRSSAAEPAKNQNVVRPSRRRAGDRAAARHVVEPFGGAMC